MTLLNNWEATYFDFDETKLSALYKDAKNLGVDMFLLDDGWFGNKYPRNNDDAGLGDWQENKKKLPSGLGYLVKEAQKLGMHVIIDWVANHTSPDNVWVDQCHQNWSNRPRQSQEWMSLPPARRWLRYSRRALYHRD